MTSPYLNRPPRTYEQALADLRASRRIAFAAADRKEKERLLLQWIDEIAAEFGGRNG